MALAAAFTGRSDPAHPLAHFFRNSFEKFFCANRCRSAPASTRSTPHFRSKATSSPGPGVGGRDAEGCAPAGCTRLSPGRVAWAELGWERCRSQNPGELEVAGLLVESVDLLLEVCLGRRIISRLLGRRIISRLLRRRIIRRLLRRRIIRRLLRRRIISRLLRRRIIRRLLRRRIIRRLLRLVGRAGRPRGAGRAGRAGRPPAPVPERERAPVPGPAPEPAWCWSWSPRSTARSRA